MIRKLLLTSLILLFNISGHAQNLRIATYNMRYDNKGDSLNPWAERAPVISSIIQFHDLDIFGAQELLSHQVDDIAELLPEYSWHGVGRDDGGKGGEHTPVFYRTARFELLEKGNFWLSTTPETPGRDWDALLPRICSWVALRDKPTGLKFYVFNTHFDHRGKKARRESAKLIRAKIKSIAKNDAVVLTGDFNFDQHDENFTLLNSGNMNDVYDKARIKMANNGTTNRFDIQFVTDKRIDHIFVSPHFNPKRYGILTESYKGKLPSDHFPVMTELSMEKIHR